MDERFWRSPNERLNGAAREGEFPPGADEPPQVSRRGLIQLLGASAALAGASGCSRGPPEWIVPYVTQPPEVTPSVASRYATAMEIDGYAVGMIVESHEGRPTKAEGNPAHPASAGGLGTFAQASILSLYDPTRGRAVLRSGVPAAWQELVDDVVAPAAPGKRLHILLEPTSSPHVAELVARVRRRGDVVVHFDAPLARTNAWQGAKAAFGRVVEPRWNFARADVVLALDADILAAAATPMSWARSWADRRRLDAPSDTMSRLYVVESRLSVTGMSADERLRARPSEVQSIAADVLASLLDLVPAAPPPAKVAAAARPRGPNRNWVQGVARDLLAHPGAALVVAGDAQPPAVHALAHAMNELLGAAGAAVTYGPSAIFEAGEESHGLGALGRAVDAGGVASLAIVGGNPAFTAAADLDLARRIASVPTSVYVGLHENETSWACRWFAPAAHFLESWGDAASFDGTPSIVQPLIRPLFDGRTVAQILAAYIGQPDAEPLALLRAYWNGRSPGDAQAFWERALVQGVVEGPAPPPVPPHVDWAAVAALLSSRPSGPPGGFEIAYYADSKVHDGRFAANPWLQELGDPVTKLTWDNAALVSPATASSLGVENEDVVELAVRGRTLRAPVLVLPGVADDTVAIALGYGGAIGTSVSPERVGANAYALRDSRAPWFDAASVRKVEGHWPLALTQEHWSMEGRPIALRHTLAGYRANPDFAEPMNEKPRLLYELAPSGKCQWGMTIDLNACTGCSACVVACYAENNLPVVGKGGVRLRREMDWLRIDRYFVGDADDPAVVTQPMLCQHCEAAPCEYVCPVNATVHSPDGLNEMVYNRCVGTRFCSNNCPYKVRRFNFFNYNVAKPPLEQLAMNPDVTVRDRGVMEKCTYCVQRIRETEIRAGREHRAIRDGEVLTACQQTCPTGAIAFGDIADPNTLVSGTRKNRRLYAVLHSLGTLPRTRYLARVVNPNPELRA